MLISSIMKWLSRNRPVTPSLTAQQAVALAQAAAAKHAMADSLKLAILRVDTGRPVWHVGSDAVGRTLVVSIDDATGTVLKISESGLR